MHSALKYEIKPNDVKSIKVKSDLFFIYLKDRFLLREEIFKSIVKKWKYNQRKKNAKLNVKLPVKRTDQPDWVKDNTNNTGFIEPGLHWHQFITFDGKKIKYKVAWIKDNGEWMSINLFTGETEFSNNFKIVDLKSSITAIQCFTDD